MRRFFASYPCLGGLAGLVPCATAAARGAEPLLTRPIDEPQRVTLEGNTPPAALDPVNDRGPVADSLPLDHLLLVLQGSAEREAALQKLIADMHDPAAPAAFHRWLTPPQIGARFGLARADLDVVRSWLEAQGFSVNRVFANGLVIDFSGTAGQVREALHTEIHNLVLANGEHHIANIRDPQIPAAVAPAVRGVDDWQTFRKTFGLDKFKDGTLRQIYPGCSNSGRNGDETEAALDVEWSSAAAPDANIELSSCANTAATSGLDLAILGLIDYAPPDIITDSYGLCETITGVTEVALENREAQLATAEGTTFFIAQGDNGARPTAYCRPKAASSTT